MNLERIKKLIEDDRFVISNHARTRMFQRNVSTDEIAEMIGNAEMVEDYPDAEPCPAALILGFLKDTPLPHRGGRMRRPC